MMKLVVLMLYFVSATAVIDHEDALTVTLFYESYCPDCIQYIDTELYIAWTSFRNDVLFDLLPFGNAKQWFDGNQWKFECQHGPKECLANKLHACAIYQVCGETGSVGCQSDKLEHAMDFIHCLVGTLDQMKNTERCAQKANLEPKDIVSCAQNDQGDSLLNFYGNRTTAFQPRIQYVPTVAIDGKHDTAAESDLVAEICKLRPTLCKDGHPQVIQL